MGVYCYFCSVAVLHQLISSEELAGDLQGRQEKAVYIPHVYIHNQNKWTDSFLAANEYLGTCSVGRTYFYCIM